MRAEGKSEFLDTIEIGELAKVRGKTIVQLRPGGSWFWGSQLLRALGLPEWKCSKAKRMGLGSKEGKS